MAAIWPWSRPSVLAFRLDLADRFFIFLETVVDR
jgi:hypothetical protein